jgi:hypothetical protein
LGFQTILRKVRRSSLTFPGWRRRCGYDARLLILRRAQRRVRSAEGPRNARRAFTDSLSNSAKHLNEITAANGSIASSLTSLRHVRSGRAFSEMAVVRFGHGADAPLPSRSAISRKTVAQGMPACSDCTCMLVCVSFMHFAHDTAGAASTRRSLRPPFLGARVLSHDPGASRRGIGRPCLQFMECERTRISALITRQWIGRMVVR